jgi:thiol-disulfide isomerase/thioredoxin
MRGGRRNERGAALGTNAGGLAGNGRGDAGACTGMTGLIALVVALVVATAIGLVLRQRSGKFRAAGQPRGASRTAASRTAASRTAASRTAVLATAAAATDGPAAVDLPVGSSTPVTGDSANRADQPTPGGEMLTEADLGAELGERATLVQFSTAFCAPCRPTRLILAQVAGMVDGVRHIDIDATERLDLVGRLRINSTPTILVLGPGGAISKRASGLPRKADVIAALGQVIEPVPSTTSATLIDNTGNASLRSGR